MKKFDEEENEDFCEDEYFNLMKSLFSAKKKHFEKVFAVDGVSFTELKKIFGKLLKKLFCLKILK